MKRLPMLPTIGCAPNCGECCTIVPITETEAGRIERYAAAHGLAPRDQGPVCPWLHERRCAVYDVRPLVCRLFGHAPKLGCTHHPERERDLTDEEAASLIRRNGPPAHVTHRRLAPGELPVLLRALRGIQDGDEGAPDLASEILSNGGT